MTRNEIEQLKSTYKGLEQNDFNDTQIKNSTIVRWIDMVDSCFCYHETERLDGYASEDTYQSGIFSKEELMDMASEHINYLVSHAKITKDVYTDSEGVTYNNMEY